jgi:hypothetical protein
MRVALVILSIVLVARVTSASTNANAVRAKPKGDGLLVYGDGFMFGVKEPSGWKSDTQIASRLGANVAFYRAGESPESAVALIRVRVSGKADENTMGDLQSDMDGYRQEYAGVAFEDIAVAHPSYRTFAKLFFVKDTFFEYVVYLNPGKGVPLILSVSMNKQKARATKAEFEALQEVVRTLRLFNDLRVIEQKADAGAR